jgi:sulfatase maturation enzyme AslB (radical SAM superfamily)
LWQGLPEPEVVAPASSAPATDSLAAVVTTDCNLRCRYCYQDRKQLRHMRWPILSAAIDLLPVSGRRRARLSFLGGEPLLAFPLIVRAVNRANRRQGPRRRVQFTLTTNGLLLTERRVAFLKRYCFRVQISFDGVANAQDLRAPGSFAILDGLLDRLRRHHCAFFRRQVSVAVTLAPPAIPHLAESFDYLLSKGVRH